MEVRCQNCGQPIIVADDRPGQKVQCPSCAVSQIISAGSPSKSRGRFRPGPPAEPRPTQPTSRHAFEPIPRPLVYGAGTLFVLLVLLPFWLYLFRDRFQSHPILLSDDTATLTISEASRTNIATPVFDETRPAKSSLDQFHGVQLDASRDDLQQRFPLRLRNTLGMEPEIYDARKVGDVESMTAYFYKNGLKEFSMVLHEQHALPDAVQKELTEQFGEPNDSSEANNAPASSTAGLSLPRIGVGEQTDDLDKKLAGFAFLRELSWYDDRNRIDCTIYYTSPDPTQCVSLVSIHVSNVAWLNANRPLVNVAAPGAPEDEQQSTAAPTNEPPKHLFP